MNPEAPHESVTIVLLCVVVVFQTFSRFHSPSSNRSTTTWLRYYTAATIYCSLYLVVFWMLTEFPSLLSVLSSVFDLKDDNQLVQTAQNEALAIALVVGTVLPNVPVVRNIDSGIRTYLQDRALIGYHAQAIAQELQSSRFNVPSTVAHQVNDALEKYGLNPADLVNEGRPELDSVWCKIVSVMESFDRISSHAALAAFKRERVVEFADVQDRYRRLGAMATTLFLNLRPALDADEPTVARLVATYEKSFAEEADDLWRSLCNLVSQASLSGGLTAYRRRKLVQSLGYETELIRDATPDFVALVGIAMFVATVAVNVAFSPGESFWHSTKRGFVVACSGVLSIVFAWLVRVRWGAPHKPGHFRPIIQYMIAGALATVFFVPLRTQLRAWMEGDSFPAMLGRLSVDEWPFLIITFAAAACLGFCLDNRADGWLRGSSLRFAEAVGLGACLVAAASLVVLVRESGQEYFQYNWTLLTICTVHGLLMGSFVPAWRRRDFSTPPQQVQMEAAPASSNSADG